MRSHGSMTVMRARTSGIQYTSNDTKYVYFILYFPSQEVHLFIPRISSAKIQGALRDRLNAQNTGSLRLSQTYFDNLPLDVTNVPAICGLLTSTELAITELDATAICEKIAKGELSAVETVRLESALLSHTNPKRKTTRLIF
ncbi:hypothetical protein BJ138DRAFT_1154932 [Hygrophoropsis aurantiaca]|uniref:Uncharacterized protein n=1 Tax=Hygrophoropsis aurantiaca TaxID=72124 RepID=A0ACB8A8N3_9AGAM|nr:hypothetical protein BJ138DRAFT_1154932 [Hygrophoropsis aurantiaca]